MEYRLLGRTGLLVSRLCFGSLALSPSHHMPDPDRSVALLRFALDRGVNFIDTAESYDNYHLLRRALKGRRAESVIVASKSYQYTREGMKDSLEMARESLGRSVIEIFLLHEQESALTIEGHREALEYLLQAKRQGLVKAVGISTHAVEAVKAAASLDSIDVIHPIINRRGLGIIDGDLGQMLAAVNRARSSGKGIYAMKALGGGHLASDFSHALGFVLKQPSVDSLAVGMSTRAEIRANLILEAGGRLPARLARRVSRRKRRLLVEDWCQGCGRCLKRCRQGALTLINGRVKVLEHRCILCGYCAFACRDFCLKVV